jgi:hypothetical protein
MPIVSGLSTVYGLSIPNSLLERIDQGQRPSSLEVKLGGLINIITKIQKMPVFLLMPLPPAGVK